MDSTKDTPRPAWWLRVLGRVPLPFMYALATLSAILMRDILRYRVRVARDNLRRALPELTEAERRRILRRHYQVFAEVLFELPRVTTMTPAELEARVAFAGLDRVRAEYARGQSTLLLGGHQCNWEWQLQATALGVGVPLLAAYKPPHSARADRLMLGLRGRFGARMVPGKRLLREVLRLRGRPHAVGMVADQMPTTSPGRVWLKFFGRDTAFFPGPGEIARAAGHSAYFMPLRRMRRGYYESGFVLLAAAGERLEVAEFTARYAAQLETMIRQSPEDWAWTHRRWKLQPPVTPAPAVPGQSSARS